MTDLTSEKSTHDDDSLDETLSQACVPASEAESFEDGEAFYDVEPAPNPEDEPEVVSIRGTSYMEILGKVAEIAEATGNCVLKLSLIKPVKAGRNDLCPCGSKKKHKTCCIGKRLTKEQSIPRYSYMPESEKPKHNVKNAAAIVAAAAVAGSIV